MGSGSARGQECWPCSRGGPVSLCSPSTRCRGPGGLRSPRGDQGSVGWCAARGPEAGRSVFRSLGGGSPRKCMCLVGGGFCSDMNPSWWRRMRLKMGTVAGAPSETGEPESTHPFADSLGAAGCLWDREQSASQALSLGRLGGSPGSAPFLPASSPAVCCLLAQGEFTV